MWSSIRPEVMTLLREHVPLTLLIDIVDRHGPDSSAIAESEPADLSWIAGGTPA